MNSGVSLSVIVPVYNEEEIIESSLKNKLEWLHQKDFGTELIVVNDGSADNTEAKILALQNRANLIYLKSESNLGFGGAVWKGITAAQGEKILCLPADLTISREKADSIVSLLNNYDVVACYRESKPGNSFASIVGSKIYRGLIRMMYGVTVKDLNWVHAYRKTVFSEHKITPESKRTFFLAEVLILASRKNLCIGEIELSQQARSGKKGTSQRFGTFVDALIDLWYFAWR